MCMCKEGEIRGDILQLQESKICSHKDMNTLAHTGSRAIVRDICDLIGSIRAVGTHRRGRVGIFCR